MHLPTSVQQYLSSSEMNMLHRVLTAVCGTRSESDRIARQLIRKFLRGVIAESDLMSTFMTERRFASVARGGCNRARFQRIDVDRWENEGASSATLTTDREVDEGRP
jgi:hypothetical protein